MIVLDRQQTLRQLLQLDVVEVVTAALRMQDAGSVMLPPESYLGWTNSSGEPARSIAMHAHLGGKDPAAGVKIINANAFNPTTRGQPRASGLTMIFDEGSGAVTAIMAAEDISAARTAAVSAVAVDHCRQREARTLVVVGCGPVGEWHLRVLTARGTYDRAFVFDVVAARAGNLARRAASSGLRVDVAQSAEDAVRAGDVVITATTVREPYVELEWLRKGCTVVNVSLDDLAPEVLVGCDRLFVDDWDLIVADEHRLLGRLGRTGVICGPAHDGGTSVRAVDGTIAGLASGRVTGRVAMDEVIVVNPFGMAVSDIAIARAIVDRLQ
jgi:ornithine cyclodeaminase